MPRLLLACFAVGVAALAGGCAMCSDGFDHCGPTYRDGGCCPHARSGSILSGGTGPVEATYLEEISPAEGFPTEAPSLEPIPSDITRTPSADSSATDGGPVGPLLTREEMRAGAKILSVTDHKLEELEAQQNAVAAETPVRAPATATRQSSSAGWTSRR